MSNDAAPSGQKGNIEIVANCVYREVDPVLQSSSPLQKTIRWNKKRTAADVVVRNSEELLATYHVLQLPDSVKISADVVHAEPDAKTSAARSSQMTDACLDEGGY